MRKVRSALRVLRSFRLSTTVRLASQLQRLLATAEVLMTVSMPGGMVIVLKGSPGRANASAESKTSKCETALPKLDQIVVRPGQMRGRLLSLKSFRQRHDSLLAPSVPGI